MSVKLGEVFNKLIGAGMMLGSAGFFAAIMHNPPFLIPGFLFAGGGFYMLLRRDRQARALEPPAQEGVEHRLRQLAESLSATQQELSLAQDRIERLTEERDFMRQLATPPAHAAPGQMLGRGAEGSGSPPQV